MKQKTLVILKPDTIIRELQGEVKKMLLTVGNIVNEKEMILNDQLIFYHYSHIVDKPFFPEVVSYMTRSKVVVLIIEGEDVIKKVRDLCGPTNPLLAPSSTIRGKYGLCKEENLVHSSDSPESAELEIKRFFPELQK